MASLVEVFSEFFRAFGYDPVQPGALEGLTGQSHSIPLLLEKDSRRVAVRTWLSNETPTKEDVQSLVEAIKDTGCDQGVLLSLAPLPEDLFRYAAPHRVQLWDPRRICQELGSAVLRETCPEQWSQQDPVAAHRPSRILDLVHQQASVPETPRADPVPPSAEEDPSPIAPALPLLAAADEAAPETLEVPAAFGILDAFASGDDEAAPPAPAPEEAAAEPAQATLDEQPPTRPVLRLQVNRELAGSLAKPRTRTVERLFLRLVPYHIFDYEAQILIDGSVRAETRAGRMAVNAARQDVQEWTRPLDVAPLPALAVDVDEKPVRVEPEKARRLVLDSLRGLVTRDVVMEEDDSEWSVVVKKRVELAEEDLALRLVGTYWVPIWRVTGQRGAVEIDAATGQTLHEEIVQESNDAVLI